MSSNNFVGFIVRFPRVSRLERDALWLGEPR